MWPLNAKEVVDQITLYYVLFITLPILGVLALLTFFANMPRSGTEQMSEEATCKKGTGINGPEEEDMHVTHSSGGVVVNPRGQVLVVSQKGLSWSFPKGHNEAGELPLDAAVREIYEESGVTELELIQKLGTYERYRMGLDGLDDPTELKRITLFLFRTGQEALHPVDSHNPEARWVSPDEVTGLLTHAKDKEFFESIRHLLPSTH